MSKWKTYNYEDWEQWHELPTGPGCYAIYCDGQLIYIGQAGNIWVRLKSYRIGYGFTNTIFTPWGCCDSLCVKVRTPRRFGEWLMTEARLIKRLLPRFNCVGGARKRNTPINRYAPAIEQ